MRGLMRLHLLGMLLLEKHTVQPETHPALFNIFASLGIHSTLMNDREALKSEFDSELAGTERDLDYYDGQELRTNETLSNYLQGLAKHADKGQYDPERVVSVSICAYGNKGGDIDQEEGVEALVEAAEDLIGRMANMLTVASETPVMDFEFWVHGLANIFRTLELVEVFVDTQYGAYKGVAEFAPAQLEDLEPVPDPDFDQECHGPECACCSLGNAELVIEGMESLMNGTESRGKEFLLGVAYANGLKLDTVTGNEGPKFDAIKAIGRKAYDLAMESFQAVKKLFEEETDDEKLKDTQETAENNKKSLAAMKSDTPAQINDNAKRGLLELAGGLGEDGKIKNLVSQLRAPTDGGRVIDGLMGFMTRTVNGATGVRQKLTLAETKLAALKKATDASGQGDEKNGTVVAANKQAVKDATDEAKKAVTAVKDELGRQRKLMDGLRKAITGINPKIFIAVNKSE